MIGLWADSGLPYLTFAFQSGLSGESRWRIVEAAKTLIETIQAVLKRAEAGGYLPE